MSNINNQTQDLYSIELVQDLDHEAAATVSGGALYLYDKYNQLLPDDTRFSEQPDEQMSIQSHRSSTGKSASCW